MVDVDLRGAAALEGDAGGGVGVVEFARLDPAVVQVGLGSEIAVEHPVAGVAAAHRRPTAPELPAVVAGHRGTALDRQGGQGGSGAAGLQSGGLLPFACLAADS